MTLQRRSLRSAPAVLNTADKAVWVTGWNEAVDAMEAEQAQQVAVPAGWVLVPTEALLDIKNRVNTLATLSLKAERYSVGREIKQDIADMLAATQGAKP